MAKLSGAKVMLFDANCDLIVSRTLGDTTGVTSIWEEFIENPGCTTHFPTASPSTSPTVSSSPTSPTTSPLMSPVGSPTQVSDYDISQAVLFQNTMC